MGLFSRRRTVRDVAKTIVDGLRDGSIVPDPPLERDEGIALPTASGGDVIQRIVLSRPIEVEQHGIRWQLQEERTETERFLSEYIIQAEVLDPDIFVAPGTQYVVDFPHDGMVYRIAVIVVGFRNESNMDWFKTTLTVRSSGEGIWMIPDHPLTTSN